MKKLINILAIIILGINLPAQTDLPEMPPEGPAPKINLEKPQRFTLDNGLRVLVVENHKLPRVFAKLRIDNPPVLLGEKKGVESLLGSLFGTGSESNSKDSYNEEIDFMGSSVYFGPGSFYMSSLSRFFPKTFELATDQILHPAFSEEELQKEKDKMIERIKSGEKTVATAASHLRAKVGYGKGHPYSEFATIETVSAIDLQDVKDYYQHYFRPNNAYLIIVGDVHFDEIRKIVSDHFKSWKKIDMNIPPVPEIEDTGSPFIAFVNMPNAVQSDISVVHSSALRKNNKDYFAALIANNILGGDFNSYLNMNLREAHGWTYGAGSGLSTDKYGGLFSTRANVRNEVTDSAVVETLNQMKKIIEEKADPKQVEIVKAGYSGKFVMNTEDPETVADYALDIEMNNLPEDFYENYLSRLEAVTIDEILAAARKYIHPEKAKILVVGAAKDVLPSLESLHIPVKYFDKYGNPTVKPKLSADLPEGVNVKSILDKYFDAIGGKDKAEKIQSLQISGEITMQGMSVQVLNKAAKPHKFYTKVSMMGNVLNEIVFDGEKGYSVSQGQRKELETDKIEELKTTSQPINILGLYETGEYIGREKSDGKSYDLVKKGNTTYYFDTETGLATKEVAKETINGQVLTQEKIMSKYEMTKGGIRQPMEITLKTGPREMKLVVKEILVNVPFQNEDFE